MRGASSPTAALATGLVLVAGLALTAAGCGGGGEEATAPTDGGPPAPTDAITVTVRDGDTGAPVAGARVTALRGREPIARAVADDEGRATVPWNTRYAEARKAGLTPGRTMLGTGPPVVEMSDPALQSPEYGGGPERARTVPAVRVGPPRGTPRWRFTSRTLLEFPPAVADDLVVVGTNSGRVYAMDGDTGTLRWARHQRGEIASSPAIDGDRVFMSSMGGQLRAYGANGGTTLWTFETGSPIESSPLVVDGAVYVGAWNGGLYAVDARTGKLRWRFQAGADIKGSAALAGDRIVFGDYGGSVYAVDPRTGALRWRSAAGRRFYGGPGVSGDTIVIGDVGGSVVALDAGSGAVRWRHGAGGYVYSSPAIADGTVFIGSYSGRFEALDLASGALRWSFDAGERISGSATVVGDVVYTAVLARPGAPRRTYGLDVGTGAVRFRADEGRYSPVVAAGVTLYLVGTRTIEAYRDRAP